MHAQRLTRSANKLSVRDLPLYNYNQRQLHEITATQVMESAAKIQPANNFHFNGKSWEPNEYKGFAVVSMLNNNPGNEELTPLLTDIQRELQENLRPINSFYMLPSDSFHQTVANTLSADRFKENILNTGLEKHYPAMVNNAFNNVATFRQSTPVKMRLVGLSIFGTAIGVLGTFENDADYNRVVDFRSSFYEDQQLASVDVKMTRPFIGHITLAYAEQKLNKNQREHLANTVNEINTQIFSKRRYFLISNTELRRYEHLAEFRSEPNYPVYHFTF
jgi:hypothetical protein